MSWMKRPRGSPAAVPGSGQNMYNPTQPPLPSQQQAPLPQQPQQLHQQQWQQNQQPQPQPQSHYGNPTQPYNPQAQQYWQSQQPAIPNQPAASPHNAYNQNYPQQTYPNTQQQNEFYQYGQQNYVQPNSYPQQQNYPDYQNQQQYNTQVQPQQGYQNATANFQSHEADAWNWGNEDGTPAQNMQQNSNQLRDPPANANVIGDSFANSGDSWNWSVEEPNRPDTGRERSVHSQSREAVHETVPRNLQANTPRNEPVNAQSYPVETPLVKDDSKNANIEKEAIDLQSKPTNESNIKTLNDREALMEHNILPGFTGRRFHADNLTPQWSIESQPSQDSSDGLLSHTESTNRSEDPSRSSEKSSPGFNSNDNTNFNYAQPSSENYNENISNWERQQHVENVVHNVPENPTDIRDNRELVDGVREMAINSRNRESVSPEKSVPRSLQQDEQPQNFVENASRVSTPPRGSLPPSGKKPPTTLPPSMPPFPANTSSNQNPFKRAGQLSHKTANRTPIQSPPENMATQSLEPQSLPFNLQQESVQQSVRQVSVSPKLSTNQNIPLSTRIVQQVSYSTANLETTPDNSERPDNPSPINYRPMQYPHQPLNQHQNTVENFEVAPNNDRNEYLQTGHLSDASYGDNTNFSTEDRGSRNNLNTSQDNYPPPGLRRMVLGQPESDSGPNSSFCADDQPPPGLSRMVPGQPTESLNIYTQPNDDDYLDRQIDGQTTESDSLNNSAYMNRTPTVYRQVDGQPTDDESNYNQNVTSRSSADRRPIGFDRMVPMGESSANFQSFQNQNRDERVVTGLEQSNSTEPREQNMDGSDYSEVDAANQIRSVVGATEANDNSRINAPVDNVSTPNVMMESEARDLDMEGENLQDLSTISSADNSLIREGNISADLPSRSIDPLDSGSERLAQQSNRKLSDKDRKYRDETSRKSSDKDRKYRDDTTGDESERDRMFKKDSPRKDRLRTSKERDGRYGDRRVDKERRGEQYRSERDGTRGEDRRVRKTNKDKYETEDTDYYSDRDRRKYREGSYPSGKPPRPEPSSSRREDDGRRSYDRSFRDDKDRRRRDDRDRRYDSYESDGRKRGDPDRPEERDRRYGALDRERNYAGSQRKERTAGRDERKRGQDQRDPRYGPPRPDSRDPDPIEDELNDAALLADREQRRVRRERERDDDRDRRGGNRHRRDRDRQYGDQQYYERYGYPMGQYSQQMYQQHPTYQYYEKLRLTNPQAYLEFYNKYMAGQSGAVAGMSETDASRGMAAYGEGYASMPGYDAGAATRLADERGSVHSGRSSANGDQMKDRDFNTDPSINFVPEDSTVKSERLTPDKFARAHIKGILSSTNLIAVNPSYPIDGQPAIVEILDLNKILVSDPIRCELTSYPGPLVKGTTHKKTVIEYCEGKIRTAIDRFASPLNDDRSSFLHQQMGGGISGSQSQLIPTSVDLGSKILVWELLILLLRQNGMVVGTDIAELLVKNKRQYPWRCESGGTSLAAGPGRVNSRRESASSATSRSADHLPLEENHAGDSLVQQDQDQHDSSNDVSIIDQSNSTSGNVRRESNKPSRDSAASGRGGRKLLEGDSREKYVTDKFREYLLFGGGKEALEWAMSHGLWGHALFLASKLDRRTYANVMARFANGLMANDPLQTLYQLMSGRQPAAVTCVSDEKWGDWRPHLAMILSNASQRPEFDRKSITTLGDTLQSRGDLYAAQFCYLMARVEFGKRPVNGQAPPRLVLLGSTPGKLGLAAFATNEAIITTEIYEYACSLADDTFVLVDFQLYKYLLATRLLDYGLYERALLYMERLAHVISLAPNRYEPALVERILQMADRLKYYDPEEHVGEILDDTDQSGYPLDGTISHMDGSRGQAEATEKPWITGLRRIVNDFNTGIITHASTPLLTQTPSDYDQSNQTRSQQNYYNPNETTSWNITSNQQYQSYDQLQMQQYDNSLQLEPNSEQFNQDQSFVDQRTPVESAEVTNPPQMYDPTAVNQQNGQFFNPATANYGEQDPGSLTSDTGPSQEAADGGYWSQDRQSQSYGYNEDGGLMESMDQMSRPQISMPNSSQARGRSSFDDDHQDKNGDIGRQGAPKPAAGQNKQKGGKDDHAGTKTQSGGGWFGGIFNKLSLKPKNQMILPDDKNPTIVWDPDKKKWSNKDADEDEQNTELALPPKMADIMRPNPMSYQPPPQNQLTAPTPQAFSSPMVDSGSLPMPMGTPATPNIFKLQKGRHIKKSYVDVFNPSGAPTRPLPPASEVLGAQPSTAAPTSYFVPQSTGGVNTHDTHGSHDQAANPYYNPSEY